MRDYIATRLPHIWQDKTHPVSKLLYPLSLIYGAAMTIRRKLYQIGILRSTSVSVPVIVVGNITVGGTGKTPLVIWLADYFEKNDIRVGIISRGYGGSSPSWPVDVSEFDKPDIVGDEAVMLKRKTNCPVVVSPLRIEAAQLMIDRYDVDVIISDDGLQHLALQRDLEIVVIDAKQQFGNQRMLPSGPLRDRLKSISDQAVVVYGSADIEEAPECSFFFKPLQYLNVKIPQAYLELDGFSYKKVNAVAGIGNPGKFFTTLKQLNVDIMAHPFPDHHQFSAEDLNFNDGLPVVMTEKDAVKCTQFADENYWFLQICAVPDHTFKAAINKFTESHVK